MENKKFKIGQLVFEQSEKPVPRFVHAIVNYGTGTLGYKLVKNMDVRWDEDEYEVTEDELFPTDYDAIEAVAVHLRNRSESLMSEAIGISNQRLTNDSAFRRQTFAPSVEG